MKGHLQSQTHRHCRRPAQKKKMGNNTAVPKSASQKEMNRRGWQGRQQAKRELQACDKILPVLDTHIKAFNDDGTAVTSAEVTILDKKLTQRLCEGVRWVYVGEDLGDEETDETKTELARRAGLLDRLRELRPQLDAIGQVARSCGADEKRTPDEYTSSFFRGALDDILDSGLTVTTTLLSVYLKRHTSEMLKAVSVHYADVWKALMSTHLHGRVGFDDAEVTVREAFDTTLFNQWQELLTKPAAVAADSGEVQIAEVKTHHQLVGMEFVQHCVSDAEGSCAELQRSSIIDGIKDVFELISIFKIDCAAEEAAEE